MLGHFCLHRRDFLNHIDGLRGRSGTINSPDSDNHYEKKQQRGDCGWVEEQGHGTCRHNSCAVRIL